MKRAFHSSENCFPILEDLDKLFVLGGRLRELSEMSMVTNSCTMRTAPNNENMLDGDVLDRATPPSKLPRIPVNDENDSVKVWSLVVDFVCLPTSADIASLATSTMEAPKFPIIRNMVRVIFVMYDVDRKIIDIHETTCNKTACKFKITINYS